MDTIKLKGILWEDVVNYKKISTTLMFPNCTFKCEKECGKKICQNSPLVNEKDIVINMNTIIDRYINNPLTEAIVCQGLEPFDSEDELLMLIMLFREKCSDDIVIYTGYTFEELYEKQIIQKLRYIKIKTPNKIILKLGRYIPDSNSKYDELLGVTLASDNQYAMEITI